MKRKARLQSAKTWIEKYPGRNLDPESDETFAYIAGYTSNGVPYGITWEEMCEQDRIGVKYKCEKPLEFLKVFDRPPH